MNGLKKTYKKILDHNSVLGNDRKTWPYFEVSTLIQIFSSSVIFDEDLSKYVLFFFQRMHEIFGKTGWANPKAIATEAGPSAQQAIVSDSLWTNDDKKKRCNKRKIEAVLNDYISDMKEERTEKEKKKQAKEVLKKLGKQREKQHKEKIAIMQQFLEAITKK